MAERLVGYVLWWNDEIGYGRAITCDGKEIHIHHKQFMERPAGRITCRVDQCLTFVIGFDRRTGRERAEEIKFDESLA